MRRFALLVGLGLLLSTSAQAFEYSPFGLALDLGGGVKWTHYSDHDALNFQDNPWLGATLTKDLAYRWSLNGSFERVMAQEPDYEIRAGIWYRLGEGRQESQVIH